MCTQGYHSQAPLLPAPLTPRPRPPVRRDEGGLWGFHSLSEQLPSLGLSVRGAHLGPQLEGSVPHTGPIQGEHFPFPQHRTLHTDCFTPQTRSHGPIHISQGRKQAENSPPDLTQALWPVSARGRIQTGVYRFWTVGNDSCKTTRDRKERTRCRSTTK